MVPFLGFSLGNCFILQQQKKQQKNPFSYFSQTVASMEREKILFASGEMFLGLKPFQLRVHWEIKLAF